MEEMYLSHANVTLHSDSYFGGLEEWVGMFAKARADFIVMCSEISTRGLASGSPLGAIIFFFFVCWFPSLVISGLIAGVVAAVYRAGSYVRGKPGRSEE